MGDEEVTIGTITVSLVLSGDDTMVRIELPESDLGQVQMLGMLDLARDAILHPGDAEDDDE